MPPPGPRTTMISGTTSHDLTLSIHPLATRHDRIEPKRTDTGFSVNSSYLFRYSPATESTWQDRKMAAGCIPSPLRGRQNWCPLGYTKQNSCVLQGCFSVSYSRSVPFPNLRLHLKRPQPTRGSGSTTTTARFAMAETAREANWPPPLFSGSPAGQMPNWRNSSKPAFPTEIGKASCREKGEMDFC